MNKRINLILIGTFVIGLSMRMHGQEILNKEWVIVKIEKEKITTDVEKAPWIKLSERRVSGFSGCNRLMGSYLLEGKTLFFSQLGGTKMFCFDTQELEDKFMKTLSKTHFWKSKRGKLYLFDQNKTAIMTFEIKKHSFYDKG